MFCLPSMRPGHTVNPEAELWLCKTGHTCRNLRALALLIVSKHCIYYNNLFTSQFLATHKVKRDDPRDYEGRSKMTAQEQPTSKIELI